MISPQPGRTPDLTYELEFKNIHKKFGDLWACKNISLKIKKNSIHALIGENGAGKSTLLKILFGFYYPDQGEIVFQQQALQSMNPDLALKMGLGMVQQHFTLSPEMSVLDHLILTRPPGSVFLSRPKILNKFEMLAGQWELKVPFLKKVGELSVGEQQKVELLGLLIQNVSVFIFDEPTAVLSPEDSEIFFQQILKLKNAGKTIILVTHKLKEVLKWCDEYSLLSQGQMVQSGPTNLENFDSLSAKLLKNVKIDRAESLCSDLDTRPLLTYKREFSKSGDLKFQIFAGQIVGVCGVEGNGQEEILTDLVESNRNMALTWKKISIQSLNNDQRRDLGIGYLPSDRLKQGLILSADVIENALLADDRSWNFFSFGFLRRKNVREFLKKIFYEFQIVPANWKLPLSSFSGGNQQKFLVAKELQKKIQLLVAPHPTRGVDLQSAEKIHSSFYDFKNAGGSVLVISSDLEELMKLSNRILVIFNRQIVGELKNPDWDEKKLGRLMSGGVK